MPDSSYFDGARAVEALRVVSVSIRHVILGVESRKERAGSDYKVWRAPGNAKFARNSGMRRREIAREASMERSKDASYQILVQRSRPARMGRDSSTRLSGAMRSARKPARKRKKTDDVTSEQSSPVRLPATVVPRCDGAMPGQQP